MEIEGMRNSEMAVIGWNDANQAAEELYCGFNRQLLNGKPVFLYKNTGDSNSELQQVVVVRDVTDPEKYAASILTKGWSVVYPFVLPKNYLAVDLLNDLKKYKVNSDIINIYKQIINQL